MAGQAAEIQLTATMRDLLHGIAASRTIGNAVVRRATMILRAFEQESNRTIAGRLGMCAKSVGLWRRRWHDSYAALLRMEFTEAAAAFQRAIIACLSDAPRSGSPGKFTPAQLVGVIGIACEAPETRGRPVTSWTGKELADESQRRGLVPAISASHVHRLLRIVDLQPHRRRSWCHTTETDRVRFQQQVEGGCQTYRDAPRLYQQFRTHTVCVDEMTSLQAIERRAATKLPQPGQIAKEEFQDTRHGTVCLTGNWHVVRGQLLTPTISQTRDNHDFAGHIRHTIATDPQAGWVFVVDNLNTHCGEPLVRLVAEQLGIAPDTLGIAKKNGILRMMESRRAFLSDPGHRIRFVYLPKHSSWLNQIEIIFGVINRRVLRGGNFRSQRDLINKLQDFVQDFNETIAKPMHWTDTGRPTHNTPTPRPRTWREDRPTKTMDQKLALMGMNL